MPKIQKNEDNKTGLSFNSMTVAVPLGSINWTKKKSMKSYAKEWNSQVLLRLNCVVSCSDFKVSADLFLIVEHFKINSLTWMKGCGCSEMSSTVSVSVGSFSKNCTTQYASWKTAGSHQWINQYIKSTFERHAQILPSNPPNMLFLRMLSIYH